MGAGVDQQQHAAAAIPAPPRQLAVLFYSEDSAVSFLLDQFLQHEKYFFLESRGDSSPTFCGSLVRCVLQRTDPSVLEHQLFPVSAGPAQAIGIAGRVLAALAPFSLHFSREAYCTPVYPRLVAEVITALVAAAWRPPEHREATPHPPIACLDRVSDVFFNVAVSVLGSPHVLQNLSAVSGEADSARSERLTTKAHLLLHQLYFGWTLLGVGRFWSDPTKRASPGAGLGPLQRALSSQLFTEGMPNVLSTATGRLSDAGMSWSDASDEPTRIGCFLLPTVSSVAECALLLVLFCFYRDFGGYLKKASLGHEANKARVLLELVCPAMLESTQTKRREGRICVISRRQLVADCIAAAGGSAHLQLLRKIVARAFKKDTLTRTLVGRTSAIVLQGTRGPVAAGSSDLPSVGLTNLGNTCFANSCLQMLFRCKRFSRDVIQNTIRTITALIGSGAGRHLQLRTPELAPLCVGLLFAEMQHRLQHPEPDVAALAVEPDYLIESLPAPFNSRTQQDASEVSKVLLGYLEEATGSRHAPTPSLLQPPSLLAAGPREGKGLVAKWFEALAQTTTTCLACGNETVMQSPVWDLSVPIPKRPTSLSAERIADPECNGMPGDPTEAACCHRSYDHHHLQHLVMSAFDPRVNSERLAGEEQFQCDRCGTKVDALRSTVLVSRRKAKEGRKPTAHSAPDQDTRADSTISSSGTALLDSGETAPLPPYLTVQLNRFEFIREQLSYHKVAAAVEIPRLLLVPYLKEEEHCKKKRGREGTSDGDDDDVSSAPAPPMEVAAVGYRLLAVVVHSGPTPNSGHYYTIVRSESASGHRSALSQRNALAAPSASSCDAAPSAASTVLLTAGGHADDVAASEWFKCNDSSVRQLDSREVDRVLEGEAGAFSNSDTPYLAVYEAVNSDAECEAVEGSTAAVLPAALQAIFDINIAKAKGRPYRCGNHQTDAGRIDRDGDNDNDNFYNGGGGRHSHNRDGFGGAGRLVS
jgi:ubiquitin C-terminal hydrolase